MSVCQSASALWDQGREGIRHETMLFGNRLAATRRFMFNQARRQVVYHEYPRLTLFVLVLMLRLRRLSRSARTCSFGWRLGTAVNPSQKRLLARGVRL